MIHRYREQKYNARGRGIEWSLTYEEWLKIWTDSGKLHLRGRKGGGYVMARFGDVGPYSVENVSIVPFEQNSSEANKGKSISEEHRRKLTGRTSEQQLQMYAERPELAAQRSILSKEMWKNESTRKRHKESMDRHWATISPEQRAAWGRAISEGKRRKRNGPKHN